MSYKTADGTATLKDKDYRSGRGAFTIAPGATTGTFKVVVYADSKEEPDEDFFVDLSVSRTQKVILDVTRGVGTILNDDPLPSTMAGSSGAAMKQLADTGELAACFLPFAGNKADDRTRATDLILAAQ